MSRLIDLTGQRFGRLVVTGIGGRQRGLILWNCTCDCGNESKVLSSNLRRGKQVSCGCYNADRILKHGASAGIRTTPEYSAWKNIRKRCYFEQDNEYWRYGGMNIKVCDRWLESFENFFADMGERPSPNHSIDRIDGNGDYEPSNCRWATTSEQIINQRLRDDNTSGCKGVSWDKRKGKWFSYISPGYKEKRICLGYFTNLQDAIDARKQAESKYRNKQPS